MNSRTATQVLEVSIGSSFSEIKYAYRKLSLQCHPDKNTTEKDGEKFKIAIKQTISLKKDDVVYIPKNILHTHGAIKNSIFSHIAINSYPRKNVEPKTVWYESDFKNSVTDILK